MDKTLLALFRKMFSVDSEVLPDSMTTEEFGKFVEEQDGELFVKSEDFKNLQKKLSEKDLELKEFEKNSKKKTGDKETELSKLTETVNALTEVVVSMKDEKKTTELSELYPDISPTLLKNTPDDQLETVVAEQRKIASEHYKGADIFTKPQYKNVDEIEKEIQSVNESKTLNGLDKATEIMRLNRVKQTVFPVNS